MQWYWRLIASYAENFRAEDVGDGAKELCKNWFYKIYSIRELVPRVYVVNYIIICMRVKGANNVLVG